MTRAKANMTSKSGLLVATMLSVALAHSCAFVMRLVPTSTNNIHIKRVCDPDSPCDAEIAGVLLPGSLLPPASYVPFVQELQQQLLHEKNIASDWHIVQYCCNSGNWLEVEACVDSIVQTHNYSTYHLISHSWGGVLATSLPNVSSHTMISSYWGANLRTPLNATHPPPFCVYQMERDRRIPFLDTATRLLDNVKTRPKPTHIAISSRLEHNALIRNATHTQRLQRSQMVGNVSAYLSGVVRGDAESTGQVRTAYQQWLEKVENYTLALTPIYVGKMAHKCQEFVSPFDSKIWCRLHSLPTDMLSILLYVVYPEWRVLVDRCLLFPGFVLSHPDDHTFHAYVPPRRKCARGRIKNSEMWLKLKQGQYGEHVGKELNALMYTEAIKMLPPSARDAYLAHGKHIQLGDDIVIAANNPLCGAVWLATPLSITNTKDGVLIRAVTLQTSRGPSKFHNRCNVKVAAVSQFLEWILQHS